MPTHQYNTRCLNTVERFLRDTKITEIYEGTSEIQRLVIFLGLMKEAENNWMATV